MRAEIENFLTNYEELKKKYGSTNEFRKFENDNGFDIEFLKFQKKNRLRYNKKGEPNKQFSPRVDLVFIKDETKSKKRKGNPNFPYIYPFYENKNARGYPVNIQTGWKILAAKTYRCSWCQKPLKGKQIKFCRDSHRKLFSKVINIGKKRYGFDLNKPNHILVKPALWKYSEDGEGEKNATERIEFKNIEFSINGKRYPLTKKSRTI